MIEIVDRRWSEHDQFAPHDLNEVYLLLGYVRAFRCFDTIVRLVRTAATTTRSC